MVTNRFGHERLTVDPGRAAGFAAWVGACRRTARIRHRCGCELVARGGPIRSRGTKPDDPALMIYTSGTTGPPKEPCMASVLLGHLPGFQFPHHFCRSLADDVDACRLAWRAVS
ncbi:AMP-binding protein [Sinorhizobium meliloti]|nr:AMP-binding protein [Sinorhizobium meliloti]